MNKYVIFDLDGTLFDSMQFWDGVGREFLKTQGIDDIPADFNDKVKAMSVEQSCNYFRETFHVNVSNEYISDSMKELVADKYRYEADFKPNVRATLDILRRSGVKMCIATATYRELVEEALDRLEARDYFEFVLSCNDIGMGKDNPLIYNTAMSRMGGNLDNTVVVEDALHAVITARRAGFKVVAVHERYHDVYRDRIAQLADAYIETMDADTILNI